MPPFRTLIRVALVVMVLVACHFIIGDPFTWWLPLCFFAGWLAGYYYSVIFKKGE